MDCIGYIKIAYDTYNKDSERSCRLGCKSSRPKKERQTHKTNLHKTYRITIKKKTEKFAWNWGDDLLCKHLLLNLTYASTYHIQFT